MKKKIRCIYFFTCFNMFFFIVSIVNFMEKKTTTAIPYLLLGISFFYLAFISTNLKKINKHNLPFVKP